MKRLEWQMERTIPLEIFLNEQYSPFPFLPILSIFTAFSISAESSSVLSLASSTSRKACANLLTNQTAALLPSRKNRSIWHEKIPYYKTIIWLNEKHPRDTLYAPAWWGIVLGKRFSSVHRASKLIVWFYCFLWSGIFFFVNQKTEIEKEIVHEKLCPQS